jgi:hypothetical protein
MARQQSHSDTFLLILSRVSLPVFAEREFLFAESGSYLSAFECILLLETEKSAEAPLGFYHKPGARVPGRVGAGVVLYELLTS